MFCTNCGASLKDGTKFCTKCGQPVKPTKINPYQKQSVPDMKPDVPACETPQPQRSSASMVESIVIPVDESEMPVAPTPHDPGYIQENAQKTATGSFDNNTELRNSTATTETSSDTEAQEPFDASAGIDQYLQEYMAPEHKGSEEFYRDRAPEQCKKPTQPESFDDRDEQEEQDAEQEFYNSSSAGNKEKSHIVPMIVGGVLTVVALGSASFVVGQKLASRSTDVSETQQESSLADEEGSETAETRPPATEKIEDVTEKETKEAEVPSTENDEPKVEEGDEPEEDYDLEIHATLGDESTLFFLDDMTDGIKAIEVTPAMTFQSSFAEPSGNGKNEYYAWKAFDGKPETSWQEGVDGDGIGEQMGVKLDRSYPIKAMTFKLGNHRSEEWYIKNNRPKLMTIDVGDYSFDVTFNDEMKDQVVTFSTPIDADNVRFTIDGVYPGSDYQDTAIAEVCIYEQK